MSINLQQLKKQYGSVRGEAILALDKVDLTIRDGAFVTVVGPSGCGKSTLLKILCGLLAPSEGQALLDGTPINGPHPDVGVVFQEPRLLPWLTVLDNVLIPLRVQKKLTPGSSKRAKELLDLTGLGDFSQKYPFELSGGMQQRAAICRALIHNPSLLLMDEPFGALDAMTREFMNLELLRIWAESGNTVLFITHSIPEAVFLADQIIVMTPRPGRVRKVIEVDIPRPRSTKTMSSPAFGALTEELRDIFEATSDFH